MKKLLLAAALALAPVAALAQQRWSSPPPPPAPSAAPPSQGPAVTSQLPSYYHAPTLLGRHNGWEVYATYMPNRLFMACVMLSPTGEGGALVQMGYYPGVGTDLKVRDGKWQLDPNETDLGGVEFGFSGAGKSWGGVAHIETQAMGLLIADPLTLLNAFQRGGTVEFSARQYWREWSLVGAAEAAADMMRCIQNHPG